ncbi:hypothetical protein [Saccharopolyspora hattusasensis]|uniref:hypothetical protein n=1 Tax=Saccharopolyspora hattusasensis TaxID=1128679 RepID=UPI003D968936
MSRYLEEAAGLLRKAAEDNERKNQRYDRLLCENRVTYAQAFAELAAIDKGLLPDRLAAKYVAEGYSAR